MSGELKDVGARIRKVRTSRKMSQAELAEKLNISLSHMSDIERGVSNFGVDILMRITEVLQVSADELLRTDVPAATAVYAAEISEIISGCTQPEKEAMMTTLRSMKAAFQKNK